MTTKRKRPKVQIKTTITPHIEEKPKYKYNYSCNNSKVSYSKSEFGENDSNKGNIYIGKNNGNSYYYEKKYNNFGSLTIIQHNVENSKKNRYRMYKNGSCCFDNTLTLPKSSRNKFNNNNTTNESQKNLGSSRSSWTIFCNTVSGRKAGENKENLN